MECGYELPENMERIDLAALIPEEGCKRTESYLLFLLLIMIAVGCIDREDWFENRSEAYSTILSGRPRYYKPLIILACQEYEATGKDRTWLIERSKRLYQLSIVSLRFSSNDFSAEYSQARKEGGPLAKKPEERQKERNP